MSILVAPLEALTDARLTDPERRVLLALFSFRDKTTNTVWPSIDRLAARAHLNDKTRVSKLTKSLSEKGWLTKKKRGFTGGNQYTLSVPSILDSDANLGNESKKVADTNSNLDSDTNSNLDSAAKNKEQTSEQTIYQTIETPSESGRKRTPSKEIDFSSWPTKPSDEILSDWKKTRKAPLTQTAVKQMAGELHQAAQHGYSVDHCLSVCCLRNWRGFKCEWLLNHESNNQQRPQQAANESSGRTRDMSALAIATDDNW